MNTGKDGDDENKHLDTNENEIRLKIFHVGSPLRDRPREDVNMVIYMTGGLLIQVIYVGKPHFGKYTFRSHKTGSPLIQWVAKAG